MRRVVAAWLVGVHRALLILLWVVALLAPVPAGAASYTVTDPTDYWLNITETQTVEILGLSNSSCAAAGADPYLWLYRVETGGESVIAYNDDGYHNEQTQCLSSRLSTELTAGVYRLRAGFCCNGVDTTSNHSYVLSTDVTLHSSYSTFNFVKFSYGLDYIEQTVDISSYAGEIDAILITPSVRQTYSGPDRIGTAYRITDANGTQLRASQDPPTLVNVPTNWWSASVSFSVQDSTAYDSLRLRIYGTDAENWGGNYGPQVRSVTLRMKLDGSTEWTDLSSLLVNPTFSSMSGAAPTGWSSNRGWAGCQGLYSSTLCVGSAATWTEATPDTTTTTTTTTSTSSSTSTTATPTTLPPISPPAPPPTTAAPTTTTTTVPPTTTTSLPASTTSLPTTTTVPATTTTVVPTTTTSSPTSTTVAPATTTSTIPVVTVPPTTAVVTTPPPAATTTSTTTTSTTAAPISATTTEPATSTTAEVTATTQPRLSVAAANLNVQEIDEAEEKLINSIAETDPDLAEEVAAILDGDIKAEEMVALVEDDGFTGLDDDTARLVVVALNDADEETKAEFEEQVNVFSGLVDDYQPSGSTVPVSTRRTVVAVAAAATVAAQASVSGPTSSSRAQTRMST